MTGSISSCCAPCVPAPAASTPAVAGGGDIVAQPPAKGDAPEPAPVAGGGAPAPADVTQTPAPAGGPVSQDAAPQPTSTANALPTWPQWQRQFAALGLTDAELARLGSSQLSNEQLAQVYVDVREQVLAATPAATQAQQGSQQVTTSAWSPAWAQKFAALGIPAALLAQVEQEAQRSSATDAEIQNVYDRLAAGAAQQSTPTGAPGQQQGTGTSAWTPQWEQKFSALGLPATFVQQLRDEAQRTGATDQQIDAVYQALATQAAGGAGTSQAPAGGAGWNAQYEQQFRALGMPDDVIAVYAQSGAPAAGLDAALAHVKERVADFQTRGWLGKFTDAKMPATQMWQLILAPTVMSDDELRKELETFRGAHRSLAGRALQTAASFIPGGRAVQYAMGREAVSKDKIDRSSWKEIGLAAASLGALALTVRGGMRVQYARGLAKAGYVNLATAAATPVVAGGASVFSGDAAAAARALGSSGRGFAAFVPGTAAHRETMGLAHVELNARAFNNGGAANLGADADGPLQRAIATQQFADVLSGTTKARSEVAYFPKFKLAQPVIWSGANGGATAGARSLAGRARAGGVETLTFSRALPMNARLSGNAQLVGMIEAGGAKLGQRPDWLNGISPNLGASFGAISSAASTEGLGHAMAGNAARKLGPFAVSDAGHMPSRYYTHLAATSTDGVTGVDHQWYDQLATSLRDDLAGGAHAAPAPAPTTTAIPAPAPLPTPTPAPEAKLSATPIVGKPVNAPIVGGGPSTSEQVAAAATASPSQPLGSTALNFQAPGQPPVTQ